MGTSSSRESRGPESPSPTNQRQDSVGGVSATGPPSDDRTTHGVYSSRPRGSRLDLSILGIGPSSNAESVPERRETKQERERRKLEKERVARIKERERSIKEEHVDGGYVVTLGVYTGIEDFNKGVVRQLMIERRIAPFWRGLNDFKEEWTEHQLIAAGRGLPIPKADEIPQEDLNKPEDYPDASNQSIQNLMVPISSRSQSTGSDASMNLSPSHPAFSGSSAAPHSSSSPFRPLSKTLASLTTSSKNPTSTEMVPREIQLPRDPFVNGQAIEVFLYKDATECPICFLYYPPYLNKTRCCDQPICSECFVQIKRPDPHVPEHEHSDPSNPAPPPPEAAVDAEALVSEPATCPYCQRPEFGITYEPPPFRRGLSYANLGHGIGVFSSAMSSSSSLASSPTTLTPSTHKRRTTSISANASTVITTDRVRPDWATKLANARSHLARRSAAATALHTAAYLIGNGSGDSRSFGFTGRSRFGRNRSESSPASGAATPPSTTQGPTASSVAEQISQMRREVQELGENTSSRRRSRMDDLEDMMMMEAIRLSLAAEEERKKKAEKETAKDAKKKVKEEKKREKKEKKVYGSGPNSASGSALSLTLPGLGRRRGNSGASNLQNQVTLDDTEPSIFKGKGVDRSVTIEPSESTPIDLSRSGSSTGGYDIPGLRHIDTSNRALIHDSQQPIPSPTAPDKPSHLRQMSNASSPASSFIESVPGSLRNDFHTHGSSSTIDSPNTSGTNLVGQQGVIPEGGDSNGGTGPESMFNFQSLAAMIGKDDKEYEDGAASPIEYSGGVGGTESSISEVPEEDPTAGLEESIATLKVDRASTAQSIGNGQAKQVTLLEPQETTPEVMVTPETPATAHDDDGGKQLGAGWSERISREITQ